MENQKLTSTFATNALISKDNLGFLFVVPYFQVAKFGDLTIITQNTCKTYDAVVSSDGVNRSFNDELTIAINETRNKINGDNSGYKREKGKLLWFCDELATFIQEINNIASLIFPSYVKETNILGDLNSCLPCKFKSFAFPFSGYNDKDEHTLLKDTKNLNVAKLYGLEKVDFKNGSDLVSWLPTTKLDQFCDSLKELLKKVGYNFDETSDGRKYYVAYLVQSFMNVIFAENPYLPLQQINKIVNNYMKFVNDVFNGKKDLFGDLKKLQNEKNNNEGKIGSNQDYNFVRFLFKKICTDTSLKDIITQHEEKYLDAIVGTANLLCNALHANQMLAFKKLNEDIATFSDGVKLKNNFLYVPFYKIIQNFSESENFRGSDNKFYQYKNSNESKKLKKILTFMINLAGKLRHEKASSDLSETEDVKNEFKFGWQISHNGTSYKKPVNYDTDIDLKKLINLTKEIIDFEEYITENSLDLDNLIKYLLDGRYFGCIDDSGVECIKKIIENKDLMEKFIKQVNKANENDKVRRAYKIFLNDYFDFIENNDFIKIEYLEDENLVKFFSRPGNNKKIMDLKPVDILKLDLVSKLDVDIINSFLVGNDDEKRKINEVLELCVNQLDIEKLSKLNFGHLDLKIVESIILFKSKILSDAIVKKINFKKLSIEAQTALLNWMAQTESKFSSFTEEHLKQISCDVFIDESITFQLICNFSQFLSNNKSWKFTRYDILNKLPLDFLIVYELIKCGTNYAYFRNFLKNCVDLNEYFEYTNEESSNEQISKKQILLIDSEILDIKNFSLSDETEKFICKLINNFYNVNKSNNNKSYIQDVHNIFGIFRGKQSEDIKPIIKYVFDDCKHFRLCVFIILEFIISDDVMDGDLQQIQNNIKDALGWSDKESREQIIKGFFSCIDDINKFISCFWDDDGITKLYISFLNNLISKHIDNIGKDDFCKIQFYYLESKNIKALCDKSPQSIRESNFSRLKDNFNSTNYYKTLELILSKIVPVADIYKKNREAYDKESNSIDSIYCMDIESQAGMIFFGNGFDQKQAQGILEEYNNEGKYNENSPVYLIFKAFIEEKLTVDEFSKTYNSENDLNTTKLKNVSKNKDYSEFVSMFLPVIEKDWKSMSFRDFAIKYKLLEQICTSDVDATNIINFYADFQEGTEGKLQYFIKKYCLNYNLLKGKDSDKGKIAAACCNYESLKNEKEKNSKGINGKLNDKDICCSICYDQISQLDCIKDNNFVLKIIDFLRKKTQVIGNSLQTKIQVIGNSLETITSNGIWINFINENFQNQKDQAKKYLREVKDIIERFHLIVTSVISQYKSKQNDTHWVEEVLSIDKNGEIYNELSSIYRDYKSKQESDWINFSERHILKCIYTDRMTRYHQYKKMEKQCESLEANKSYLENLLKTFCSELKIKCDYQIDHDNDRIKSKLLYIFRELEDEKVKLLQKWNFKLSDLECPKLTQENGLCGIFIHFTTTGRMVESNPDLFNEFRNRYGILSYYDKEARREIYYMSDISNCSSKFLIQLAEDAKILRDFVYLKNSHGQLTMWIESVERYMFKPGIESFIKLLVQYSELTFATYSQNQNNAQHLSKDDFQKLQNDLQQFREKYSKYENQFLHLNDLFEIKNDFGNDFKKAKEIINNMQPSDENEKKNLEEMEEEIEKCMNLALNADDINLDRANYDSILALEKFLELAYENNFFSDEQILDTGIINFYDVNLLQEEGKEKKGVLYTPNFIIKRLGLMINHNSTITSGFNDAETRVIENLHIRPTDGNYLEDFVNQHTSSTSSMLVKIMEKIFYYRFKNIDNDCYNYDEAAKRDYKLSSNDQTNNKKVNLRIFLRTKLLELLGYSTSANKKIKINDNRELKQYKDMLEGNYADIYGFLLADFSFVGLIKKFSKDEYNSQDITEAFNDLIDNVRKRLLSLLNCFGDIDRKINGQTLEEIKKQDTLVLDLNELIARGILRSASKLFNELSFDNKRTILDIILSMLARCSSVYEYNNKKFNSIEEMKEWIQSSSLKCFVPLRLPDNPLSNYSSVFERMFTYIANKLKSQIEIDWLEKLYLNFSEYESEKDKIYKAKMHDSTVMIWLEDVVNSNNAGRALPIILKFLNENKSSIGTLMDWDTSRTAIDFFRKAGIIDGSKKFTNQQSVKMWFEFMWGLNNIRNINHQKAYNKLIDTFYTLIDFRFVSESDVIDLLNSSLPNLFPQTPYGVFLDFHGLADKILGRVFTENSGILADNDFVIKFIKFLFDTGCVIKDRGSNTLDTEKCISLLDKILRVRQGCTEKDFKRFELIYSTLLEKVEPNAEYMKNHLKTLKQKYAYHMLCMANSLKEMTQILQFIKSSNEGQFPIIKYTDIDPQFKDVLCKIWDNLENIRANGKADMESNEDTFILFMDFFKSIQLKSENEILSKRLSIAKFIGWLCPLKFANADTLAKYINLIKEKCFSSCSSANKDIVKLVLQILFFSKGQDRTENLSIFDVMFLLCEYGNIYALYGVEDYNTGTDNIFNVVKHFLEKWFARIQKELKDNKDNNDSLIQLADQKDKFNILIQTVLYSSSILVNRKQDFSCMKTLLSCLSMIKNITKINNDKDLKRYYEEIWSPIFESNFRQINASQVGVCRKIMLEHLLCGQENEALVPEILKFVIKKFPVYDDDEIEENKKILIDSELIEKILGFYIKGNNPEVARYGHKLLKALFKSNCFDKCRETSLIKTFIIKLFDFYEYEIKDNVDVNTFMKDLTNSLNELAGDSEFDNKVVLKKLFSLKANGVKVYQMLIFIARSKSYGEYLLNGITIQFTENDMTILGADNNSLLTEPIDNDLKNIKTLCDLLSEISVSGCVINCDQLISQLDDGCITGVGYFRTMAERCNDIKILRTKINSRLINDNFRCIMEATANRFTLPRDNDGKIDCGEFFDLFTGGFVYPKDASEKIEFGNMEYNIETYINKFDSVLVDKSDEYLSVCVSQFAINLNNIGTKISNNDSTLLWFITMYLLISIHMYKEELLEQSDKSIEDLEQSDKSIEDLVASIFNKNKNDETYSKICKLNKADQSIFNTAFTHAIKIFLIGDIKAEIDFYNASNSDGLATIEPHEDNFCIVDKARKFGIELTSGDNKLIKKYLDSYTGDNKEAIKRRLEQSSEDHEEKSKEKENLNIFELFKQEKNDSQGNILIKRKYAYDIDSKNYNMIDKNEKSNDSQDTDNNFDNDNNEKEDGYINNIFINEEKNKETDEERKADSDFSDNSLFLDNNSEKRIENENKNIIHDNNEKDNGYINNIVKLFKREKIDSQRNIPIKRRYSCDIDSKNYNIINKIEKSDYAQSNDNSFYNKEKSKEKDKERKADNTFSNNSPFNKGFFDNNSEKQIENKNNIKIEKNQNNGNENKCNETEKQNKFNFLWVKIIIGLFILAAAVLLLFVGFVIFGAIAFCISMYQIFTGLKFGSSNEKTRSNNLINSPLNNQIENKNSLLDMGTHVINQDKENSQKKQITETENDYSVQ